MRSVQPRLGPVLSPVKRRPPPSLSNSDPHIEYLVRELTGAERWMAAVQIVWRPA